MKGLIPGGATTISMGYRGTFSFGKEGLGLGDLKFRKVGKILVCGRLSACREVFGDSLNESREPDHGDGDRYSSRLYLKHSCLEQAFDSLYEKGFKLITSTGSGANSTVSDLSKQAVGGDPEENKWQAAHWFVFVRH